MDTAVKTPETSVKLHEQCHSSRTDGISPGSVPGDGLQFLEFDLLMEPVDLTAFPVEFLDRLPPAQLGSRL